MFNFLRKLGLLPSKEASDKVKKDKLKKGVPQRAFRKFNVSGVTYENRQQLISSIVRRHGPEGSRNILLTPEPENKHDPNAVRVVFEGIGVVGYVPKERAIDIADVLSKNSYKLKWTVKYYSKAKDREIGYMEVRLYPKK